MPLYRKRETAGESKSKNEMDSEEEGVGGGEGGKKGGARPFLRGLYIRTQRQASTMFLWRGWYQRNQLPSSTHVSPAPDISAWSIQVPPFPAPPATTEAMPSIHALSRRPSFLECHHPPCPSLPSVRLTYLFYTARTSYTTVPGPRDGILYQAFLRTWIPPSIASAKRALN